MVDVNMLMLGGAGYPKVLTNLHNPPKQLFWQGACPDDWLDRPKVAIVGSRRITTYGKYVTDKLARELSGYGVVIISGLALGVDGVAHQACLDAGGTAVAVLPTPLDKISPTSHRFIAEKILKNNGTLISEYSSSSGIQKHNFIARNRIVSGLCDILLITEAGEKSGTMHTARFALEQGKTVMAVPGNINSPTSQGCNNLIKSGAIPVTEIEDVLFALKIDPAKKQLKLVFNDPIEQQIYNILATAPKNINELYLYISAEPAIINSALTMLEIQGTARPLGNGIWTI